MNLTDSCLYIDHQECFRGIQWDTQSSVYALEVQEPFSQYLLTGQKCIETREYPLPTSLQNCPILLMETTSSTPCTSSLDDSVRFPMHPETKIEPEADMVSVGWKESSGAEETTITATANPNRDEKQHPHIRIIGALVFSRSQVYLSESMWRHDDKYHMVSPNSAYGWSETKNKFGWHVSQILSFEQTTEYISSFRQQNKSSDAVEYEDETNSCQICVGKRVYRSIFELDPNQCELLVER